ncbi:DUF3817 domain-containing protein [Umezawaea sp.]|uniref:DUF3817 domain-containing protein n=1 Tax=Umezawaea sp. TaxID=1955258 RepID=UPI002ED276DD
MRPPWQPLPVAAGVELISLTVLLLNLATVHWPAVASLMGPTHGCAYLFVVIATARHPRRTGRLVLTALVPAIGGLLVLRHLSPAHDAQPGRR